MPVFKNESNGTWYVMSRYVNWKGERKQKCKRGFATKREAQEWERMFQLQNSSDMDMSFEAFTELYIRDMKSRLKENTWMTKEHIIRTKILPYFGKLKISEISTKEVIAWQNEMLAYRDEKKKPYSQTPTDHAYWRDVGTIKQFYDAHMDLIAYVPEFNLYNQDYMPTSCMMDVPTATT